MLKYEHVETFGWRAAIRGARNPMNSWNRMDSEFNMALDESESKTSGTFCYKQQFVIGPNDYDLCKRLIKAGSDHRKFLRMIHVQFDIDAPMSWWKEADTLITV